MPWKKWADIGTKNENKKKGLSAGTIEKKIKDNAKSYRTSHRILIDLVQC